MNTRTALRKSMLIAPAENAIRNAENQDELEDAWFDFADGFSDESEERKHLLSLYMKKSEAFKLAEKAARMLRV